MTGGSLEDFSFYSEIFWETISEVSNIFCWLLCSKKKVSGSTQQLSAGFQLYKVSSHKSKPFLYYILVWTENCVFIHSYFA